MKFALIVAAGLAAASLTGPAVAQMQNGPPSTNQRDGRFGPAQGGPSNEPMDRNDRRPMPPQDDRMHGMDDGHRMPMNRMSNHHGRMSRHVRACQQRYRSYNPRTDRYVVRAGVTRRCML